MTSYVSDSIVEYFGQGEGHSCGYCKAEDTNFSYGMWGHTLKVSDYQDLIDRGWRRSGRYLYKPQLSIQCCPMYTIKNDALAFKISNSHKKVIKNFNRYINFDIKPKNIEKCGTLDDKNNLNIEDSGINKADPENILKIKHAPKPGLGEDVSKPKCKKAKQVRAEKKREKMQRSAMGGDGMVSPSKKCSPIKSLEQYLNETVENPCHKLRIELIRSRPENESLLISSSHSVYQKYQTIIHHDELSDVKESQFKRFLINSALIEEECDKHERHPGYGSFHQQYWIDDKLVAVGVIDILPRCVSSVYLFYDPEFNFLSLGTYAALREIEFVRKLHEVDEDLSSYYMGFYIHSCQKMKYKAQFHPSFLLCPETFTWHPIERCLPLLDANKYSRFASPEAGMVMKYSDYLRRRCSFSRSVNPQSSKGDAREYAHLVGRHLSEKMLLVRE